MIAAMMTTTTAAAMIPPGIIPHSPARHLHRGERVGRAMRPE